MGKKLTQEEYIRRCIDVHGDKYGLQHTSYTRSTDKVDVECSQHGVFHICASSFMRGTGCAKCAWEQNGLARRSTQEEFIRDSTSRHGDDYSYARVQYERGDKKVDLVCNGCGQMFQMTPEAHIAGQGCRPCGYKRNGKGTQKEFSDFVKDSVERHGNLFSYDHVEPLWAGIKNTKFELYCKVHQESFTTTANTHAKGAGCPRCSKIAGGIKNRSNTDKFIKDGVAKFGAGFDYSEVAYVKNNMKVKIRCVGHDKWFSITPNAHIHPDSNGGCPACAQAGYKTAKPGYLYVLHEGDLTKVGITNRKPDIRCKSVSRESCKDFKVLKQYYCEDGAIPRNVETALLRELRARYEQPLHRFDGYKESFYDVNMAALLNRIEELISIEGQHSSHFASQEA